MDATNDDEATMMAAMGLAGFGSTKVSVYLSYVPNPFPYAIYRVNTFRAIRRGHLMSRRCAHGGNI